MSTIRRVFIIALSLGIIISCIYGYLYFKRVKTPANNALKAIPLNASLIIESKNMQATWQKLSHSNLIWKDLLKTETFNKINNNCSYIDSLISSDSDISELLNDHPVFISTHAIENTVEVLYCASIPTTVSEQNIHDLIRKGIKPSSISTKESEGSQINTINLSASTDLYYCISKGILILSTNSSLVELSIAQLNSGTSVIDDPDFKKIHQTTGDRSDATLYINYKNTPALLLSFLNSPERSNAFDHIGSWSALDINLKTNEVLLSGFTEANDSSVHYLSTFESQKPQEINVTEILPQNTS